MRPIRWLSGIAAAVRGRAARFHRRTEHLSRLPFVVAVAVAALLLVAANESAPDADSRVSEVEELSLPDYMSAWDRLHEEKPAQAELVDYGFGIVTDERGAERISVGMVMRNPHDVEIVLDSIPVIAHDGEAPVTVEELHPGSMPPESELLMGYVLRERVNGVDIDRLRLEPPDAYMWTRGEDVEEVLGISMAPAKPPEVRVTGWVPLAGVDGYRLLYEVEVAADEGYADGWNLDVVFRDAEGRIVGGMPAWENPFWVHDGATAGQAFPPGVSRQQLDLSAEWMPEGTDLERTEIGPGL